MNKKFGAILLLAGNSTRFKNNNQTTKQISIIKGKESFLYPLDSLISSKLFSYIVLVCKKSEIELIKKIVSKYYNNISNIYFVVGGTTRDESVFSGLCALKDLKLDYVFIHDAARIILPIKILTNLADTILTCDAVTPVIPIVDSLMRDNEYINRDNLVRVQTPQAFNFKKICDIYLESKSENQMNRTDDFQKAIANGLICKKIMGSPLLIKLTFPEDLSILESIL